MALSSDPNLTALLRAWGEGDESARDKVLPLIYGELRRQAARQLHSQPAGHTSR